VASQLNISRDRLRRIEKGESQLPVEFIPTLSRIYGITYSEIIEGIITDKENNKSVG
jgi:transcriptional regulator with XRE-family HTH domain